MGLFSQKGTSVIKLIKNLFSNLPVDSICYHFVPSKSASRNGWDFSTGYHGNMPIAVGDTVCVVCVRVRVCVCVSGLGH